MVKQTAREHPQATKIEIKGPCIMARKLVKVLALERLLYFIIEDLINL